MSPTKRPERMLKPREVSEQLNVGYLKALSLIAAGEFPNTINVASEGNGARYRTPQSDVDRFRESRRIEHW